MTIYFAAAPIARGQPVCLTAWPADDTTRAARRVVPATPEALAAAGAVLGVALVPAIAGAWVEVADAGLVSGDVVRVAGRPVPAAVVVAGPTASIERVDQVRPEDFVLGCCDADGRVTVAPRREVATVARRMIDVRDYGARGDNVHDDLPAFHAAIAACPFGTAATIYVPPGAYKMSRDLRINRPVHLLGAGGGSGGGNGVALHFTSGGIVVENNQVAEELGNAQGAVLENLRILGTPPTINRGRWAAHTEYFPTQRVHAWVEAPGVPRVQGFRHFYWECVRQGFSGSDLLRLTTPDDPNAQYGFVPPLVPEWTKHTLMREGQCVLPRFGGDGPRAQAYRCTFAPGGDPVFRTTGADEPEWLAGPTRDEQIVWEPIGWAIGTGPSPHLFDEPGGLRWVARVHAGIRVHLSCVIRHCWIQNFLNAGIYLLGHSSLLSTNCDAWTIQDTLVQYCGTGVIAYGNDANNGTALGVQCTMIGMPETGGWIDYTPDEVNALVDAQAAGLPIAGNGGHAIHDLSHLGCNWIGCHTESVTDRGILINSDQPIQRSTVIGCHNESAHRPSFVARSSVVIGGTFAEGLEGHAGTVRGYPEGMTSVFERDTLSRGTTVALHPSAVTGRRGDAVLGWTTSRAQWLEWRYGVEALPGEWTFGHDNMPYLSVGDGLSPGGHGWRDVRGHFRGHPQSEYYLGVYTGTDRAAWIRRGRRLVGDRFEMNVPLARSGNYIGKVVVDAGYVGADLVATTYRQFDGEDGDSPNTVQVGEHVYMCTRSGASTRSVPAAPPDAPTWYPAHQELMPPMTWAANTRQVAGMLVRPTRPADHGFAYFRCSALRGAGFTSKRPDDEPDWNTGTTHTDRDVTWERVGVEDPGSIVDEGPGRAQWTRMSRAARFADYGAIADRTTVFSDEDAEAIIYRYRLPGGPSYVLETFDLVVSVWKIVPAGLETVGGVFTVQAVALVQLTGNAQLLSRPIITGSAPGSWSVELRTSGAEVLVAARAERGSLGAPARYEWRCLRRPK